MKIEKIIQKMLARPKEIAYKDVKKVLEHEGWILDRVKGSHHIYVKKDGTLYPLVLPVHGKMLCTEKC